MNFDVLLAVSAPLAFATMAAEAAWGRRRGLSLYRWRSLLSDMSCSTASLVFRGVLGISSVACYALVEARLGLMWLDEDAPLVWIVGFLLMDLMLYTRHRACHRVGIYWALHAVHHQSADFNLATGQRVPWLQEVQLLPFVLVPAVVGFPFEIFVAHYTLATIWAFWTHTQVIGNLGWFETVFVTPSHHRVHHACNGGYVDRNFGAVLIVWDRLFGTFRRETEPCVYGTPFATDHFDALRSNAEPLRDLARRVRRAPTLLRKVETVFRPPGWDPVTREEQASQADPPPAAAPDDDAPALTALIAVAGLLVAALVPLAMPMLPAAARLAIGAGVVAGLAWVGSLQRVRDQEVQ